MGAGSVYALLGLGLVLVHRASGVVHVAHGATAMYVSYVFVELRETGGLVLPLGAGAVRIQLSDEPGTALAVAGALTVAAVLGLLLHLLVFRPLRAAPALAKVVASVGVMVVLQAVAVLQFGSANRFVEPLLPNRPLRLLGVLVPADRLLLAVAALVAAALLAAGFRFTTLGLATRAAAEDDDAATLLGWSPDRLAAASWVAASVLAGLAGILIAPITALNPLTYTLLVVPALAAALVSGLEGFGTTVAAALALGMAQSELVKLQSEQPWLGTLNLRAALPFLVIVAVMVLRGRLVPSRATPPAARLPAAGRPRRPVLSTGAAVALGAVALTLLSGDYRLGLVRSLIGAILCLSVVVLTGYVGQLSIAQMALAGVAGFSLSRLSQGLGVPFPVAPLLAAAAAGGVGLLIGLAARRVRGVDLAVLTLAAGVAVDEVVFRNPRLTGGLGGSRVPDPALPGIDLAASGSEGPRLAFGLLVLVTLAGCCLAIARLRLGPLGRRLLAVRVNERAAAAAGVDVARTKVTAFVLAAFLAGLGGALLGYSQGQLSYESFGVFASLSVLAVAYLGGVASITGAVLGGLLIPGGVLSVLLDVGIGFGPEHQLLLSGLALLGIAVLVPEGLAGLLQRSATRVRG